MANTWAIRLHALKAGALLLSSHPAIPPGNCLKSIDQYAAAVDSAVRRPEYREDENILAAPLFMGTAGL